MGSKTVLSYLSVDPEARIGLPSGRFTTPHQLTSFLGGCFLMGVVYGIGLLLKDRGDWGPEMWSYLAGYQGFPIIMMILSCWSASILIIKALKIRAQRKALSLQIIPNDPKFTVTTATALKVIQAIESSVEDSRRFMYLNRIVIALRSMRNVGRIGDIDEMLQSAAENDEAGAESGYTLLKGFVWAIPVLGFIGTVVGLTQAMGKFKLALAPVVSGGNQQGVSQVSQGLLEVLRGLDVAFVTTAEALILVFVIHMVSVFIRSADEAILDDTREAAHDNIASRVRIELETGG